MKANKIYRLRARAWVGGACIALAALTLAPVAQARSNVYWSIGVTSPGVAVGASNAYPVYTAPAPVYSAPAPVYSVPTPVYVQPQPIYAPPAPVYYNTPVVVRPPLVVAPPVPAYPIGWAPPGRFYRHHHHHRRWDSDWRY